MVLVILVDSLTPMLSSPQLSTYFVYVCRRFTQELGYILKCHECVTAYSRVFFSEGQELYHFNLFVLRVYGFHFLIVLLCICYNYS